MNMMLERSNWISKQKDHGSSYKSVKYSNSGDLSVGPGGAPSATPGCSSCQCGTGASATTAAKELQQPHDHSCFTDYVWSVQKIGGFRIFGSSLRHHPSSPQLKAWGRRCPLQQGLLAGDLTITNPSADEDRKYLLYSYPISSHHCCEQQKIQNFQAPFFLASHEGDTLVKDGLKTKICQR
ncbi:uncharacterized protein [Aegilops tauschii subsp. strangulata]|uniref:uncharacterized protein isoform X2 n=1 Tax=Aegilops tauschii subsp. strangulata TaxID=200361 RepID=UPI001ABC950E|nr:uncharacterized protein LOC120963100 isoform X2 [Aegilops tauschii subsp. strangulata]XP_044450613.1 uncharacterized protein LOC123182187 isoform X1 [Triticum aestivum]XP_044450614.1 uncharacterized protein LOC123182187 isoform X1 [Triticum aestivum]